MKPPVVALSTKVRMALYLLTAISQPVTIYLVQQGVWGDSESALVNGLTAGVVAIAAANISNGDAESDEQTYDPGVPSTDMADPEVEDSDPQVEDSDPQVEDSDPQVEDSDPQVEDEPEAAPAEQRWQINPTQKTASN